MSIKRSPMWENFWTRSCIILSTSITLLVDNLEKLRGFDLMMRQKVYFGESYTRSQMNEAPRLGSQILFQKSRNGKHSALNGMYCLISVSIHSVGWAGWKPDIRYNRKDTEPSQVERRTRIICWVFIFIPMYNALQCAKIWLQWYYVVKREASQRKGNTPSKWLLISQWFWLTLALF